MNKPQIKTVKTLNLLQALNYCVEVEKLDKSVVNDLITTLSFYYNYVNTSYVAIDFTDIQESDSDVQKLIETLIKEFSLEKNKDIVWHVSW